MIEFFMIPTATMGGVLLVLILSIGALWFCVRKHGWKGAKR